MKKQEDGHCFHLCCSAHSHGAEEYALHEDQDTNSGNYSISELSCRQTLNCLCRINAMVHVYISPDMEVSTDITVPEKQDISKM